MLLLLFCYVYFFSVCFVCVIFSVMLFSDSSSLSSTASFPGRMESLFSPAFSRIPCTSSPTLHAHSLSDLENIQGHQRSGSSGDKNTTQISAELKRELAHRISEKRGVFLFCLFAKLFSAHLLINDIKEHQITCSNLRHGIFL